jgi:hypothetical protein
MILYKYNSYCRDIKADMLICKCLFNGIKLI